MPGKTAAQVTEAVEACLRRCRGEEFPLAKIAEFLGELRSHGWPYESVLLVEVAVHRVLRILAEALADE